MAAGPALTVHAAPRRRVLWLLLVLGSVAVALGGAGLARPGGVPDVGRVPGIRDAAVGNAPRTEPGPPRGVSPTARAPRGGAAAPRGAAAPPARLRLPRLGIDAPVVAVTVDADGLLAVPEDPHRLGWWRGGATPGDPQGSVVIDGHVDSATSGPGALFRLGDSRPGDDVVLTDDRGHTTTYVVVGLRRYAKASLPVADVFARDVEPRLVLVTCGGAFDPASRHYADNVVAYAVPR